jgi:hypothetical protein
MSEPEHITQTESRNKPQASSNPEAATESPSKPASRLRSHTTEAASRLFESGITACQKMLAVVEESGFHILYPALDINHTESIQVQSKFTGRLIFIFCYAMAVAVA